MKTTTEIEVQVSGARIVEAEVRSDGTCKISNDVLVLVEASKLSLKDEFMQYEPKKGTAEARFKKKLIKVIQNGVSDFLRPNMDPSFDETGESICYVAGKRPAIGKSKKWWDKVAKKVGLQVGTMRQYVAFLGCLIKKLVENGWEISRAWYAVCRDSKELGHYYNSEDAKHDLEMTGSREICGFYDLGNTTKILAVNVEEEEDEAPFGYSKGIWCAGGYFYGNSYNYPLTSFADIAYVDGSCGASVGWLVRNCAA